MDLYLSLRALYRFMGRILIERCEMPPNAEDISLEESKTPLTSPMLQYLLGLCTACLPTTMPSPKKKTGKGNRLTSRKRVRRDTWPSGGCEEEISLSNTMGSLQTRRRSRQFRPTSFCENLDCEQRVSDLHKSIEQTFPFNSLPSDCQLKIFSFLTPQERGQCSLVCHDWYELMQTSSLWNIVDLASFPMCSNQTKGHKCGPLCYDIYKKKLKKFMKYLEKVQPAIKKLSFAFDIYDPKDKWIDSLKSLMTAAHLTDLEYVNFNWKETPVKPLFTHEYTTCSAGDCQELMHRHRYRGRAFVTFLEGFVQLAPNVNRMILPLDWNERSLRCLGRLKSLHSLVLEKYSVFENLDQHLLDMLFRYLPKLERLILEVWTPSAKGLVLYRINSSNLQYLDISQCRGFYLDELNAPNLEVFKVGRQPWNGPLTAASDINIPCLHTLLVTGTPKLQQINEHTLQPGWHDVIYEELEVVLRATCSCRKHKSGWIM